MKVLFIEPCHVNFGGYFRAYNLALALSKKGVSVDLLVSSGRNFELRIRKTKVNQYFRQYELPRVRLTAYLNGRITRALIALFFGVFRKYDIIHAYVPTQLESNIPAFFLKILGKKVVLDWDDYWMGSPIFDKFNLIKKYLEFCEKRAPKFFENMTVVSVFLEERARAWGAQKTFKIINGISTDQFVPHSREESREKLKLDQAGKYLLAFGNNYANDRGLVLFKTFEQIYKLDSNIKLLLNLDPRRIISDHKLEKMINDDCLKSIVNVGNIQQKDLGYYLGASDAAALFSGDTDDQRAGFPIRVGSYLNGETVVVMNDINSEAGDILKAHGCAIIDKDIAILAQKTVAFLNDSELQKELRNNVIRAKKILSWDNSVSGLIEFYREIIAS